MRTLKKITTNRNIFYLSFLTSIVIYTSLLIPALIFLLLLIKIKLRPALFGIILATFAFLFFEFTFLNINTPVQIEEIARIESISISNKAHRLNLYLTKTNKLAIFNLPSENQFKVDDLIKIKGDLIKTQNESSYFRANKIFYEFKGIITEKIKYKDIFSTTKDYINNSLKPYFSDENLNLLLGITLGIENNISYSLKENLKTSGIYHIVSVSGFNFTLIYTSLLKLTFLFSKKLTFIISIPLIILFLFLVGTSNIPAVRATLMILFLIIGSLLGRKITLVNYIFIPLIVLLFDNPYSWQNPSLLLSFSGVIGVVYFAKFILNKLKRFRPKFLIESISTSIAVLLPTSIITLIYFHEINLNGILTNLIVLPLILPITLLFFLQIILSFTNISILNHSLSEIIILPIEIIKWIAKIISENSNLANLAILVIFSIGLALYIRLKIIK